MPLSDPKISLTKLEIAFSIQDVAFALELDPRKFFYVIQNTETGFYYREFKVEKKKGGYRNISQPIKGLALAHDRFASVLRERYKPAPFVKGYVKNESFLTNAKYHERQKWVLNLDIKDFFPSIGFARVRGLFLSKYFGFNERVATILARLSTYKNQLPQGSPVSPIIANIIAYNLDKKILHLAKVNRLSYSRYADDITLSSSQRKVPPAIVKGWTPNKGERIVELGSQLTDAFKHSRFDINEDKTRILFSEERQEVTGLIVNKKANVWRRDISKLRMKIHSAQIHGADKAAALWLGNGKNERHFWEYICGWFSYISQVRGKNDPVLAKLCRSAILAHMIDAPEWIKKSADMVREFDVFLSHASEDKPKVKKLKDSLELLDVKVFFDEDSIQWGDSIVEKINHGLLTSRFFCPFLTNTFAKKGWTNKELNSAISANVNRKGRILPIADAGFPVEENYPLLNETLYKTWPNELEQEAEFLSEVCDQLVLKIQNDKD